MNDYIFYNMILGNIIILLVVKFVLFQYSDSVKFKKSIIFITIYIQ